MPIFVRGNPASVQAFLEGERLEDSDSWFCKRCKKLVQADKKLDLWSLPEVLVVHLKRFSYSHRFRDKIDSLVKFPLHGLDLSRTALRHQVCLPRSAPSVAWTLAGHTGPSHWLAISTCSHLALHPERVLVIQADDCD